jgi:hypothetical protein
VRTTSFVCVKKNAVLPQESVSNSAIPASMTRFLGEIKQKAIEQGSTVDQPLLDFLMP